MTVIPSVSLPKPFYYSVCAEKPRIKTPERSGFLSWMSLKRLPDAPEGATGSFGRTDEVARLAEIYRELVS
jgi:hypothetical protein